MSNQSPDDLEDQQYAQQDNALEQQALDSSYSRNSTEFQEKVVTPTQFDKKSEYHKRVTRDHVLSNLKQSQVQIVLIYEKLINQALNWGMTNYANMLDSEKLAYLSTYRSIGGTDRKLLVTQAAEIRRTTLKDQTRKAFGEGNQRQ